MNYKILKSFSILLIIFSCASIPGVGSRDGICVGEKSDEYICYYGVSVSEAECLEYGYGQNKASLEFLYFENINCTDFCNQTYDSGLECDIVELGE